VRNTVQLADSCRDKESCHLQFRDGAIPAASAAKFCVAVVASEAGLVYALGAFNATGNIDEVDAILVMCNCKSTYSFLAFSRQSTKCSDELSTIILVHQSKLLLIKQLDMHRLVHLAICI
jgi:hypothetical protein